MGLRSPPSGPSICSPAIPTATRSRAGPEPGSTGSPELSRTPRSISGRSPPPPVRMNVARGKPSGGGRRPGKRQEGPRGLGPLHDGGAAVPRERASAVVVRRDALLVDGQLQGRLVDAEAVVGLQQREGALERRQRSRAEVGRDESKLGLRVLRAEDGEPRDLLHRKPGLGQHLHRVGVGVGGVIQPGQVVEGGGMAEAFARAGPQIAGHDGGVQRPGGQRDPLKRQQRQQPRRPERSGVLLVPHGHGDARTGRDLDQEDGCVGFEGATQIGEGGQRRRGLEAEEDRRRGAEAGERIVGQGEQVIDEADLVGVGEALERRPSGLRTAAVLRRERSVPERGRRPRGAGRPVVQHFGAEGRIFDRTGAPRGKGREDREDRSPHRPSMHQSSRYRSICVI